MYLYVFFADEDICKLYCIAEDFDFFFAMSSKVKDGTSCSDLKGDICIDGVCEVHWLHEFKLHNETVFLQLQWEINVACEFFDMTVHGKGFAYLISQSHRRDKDERW